jgi:hypothetical protein
MPAGKLDAEKLAAPGPLQGVSSAVPGVVGTPTRRPATPTRRTRTDATQPEADAGWLPRGHDLMRSSPGNILTSGLLGQARGVLAGPATPTGPSERRNPARRRRRSVDGGAGGSDGDRAAGDRLGAACAPLPSQQPP